VWLSRYSTITRSFHILQYSHLLSSFHSCYTTYADEKVFNKLTKLKWTGRDDHSVPSTAELWNMYSPLTSPYTFMMWWLGTGATSPIKCIPKSLKTKLQRGLGSRVKNVRYIVLVVHVSGAVMILSNSWLCHAEARKQLASFPWCRAVVWPIRNEVRSNIIHYHHKRLPGVSGTATRLKMEIISSYRFSVTTNCNGFGCSALKNGSFFSNQTSWNLLYTWGLVEIT
jgi:hypothetical protein